MWPRWNRGASTLALRLRRLSSRFTPRRAAPCRDARRNRPDASQIETCGSPAGGIGLLRLDAGEFDDPAPLLDFILNELAKTFRRAGQKGAGQLDKPRLQFHVGEARIDLPVELIDDLGRRISRRANTVPGA